MFAAVMEAAMSKSPETSKTFSATRFRPFTTSLVNAGVVFGSVLIRTMASAPLWVSMENFLIMPLLVRFLILRLTAPSVRPTVFPMSTNFARLFSFRSCIIFVSS